MRSVNPALNRLLREYPDHSAEDVTAIIEKTWKAGLSWKETSFAFREGLFRNLAALLRADKDRLARLMTEEMGKIIRESLAEIEKCAMACDYYAENAESMLKDEMVSTDASRSFVAFQPLGVILAVMPWNFPFWQVFRFAAPSLMAGNVALLKHASNVPGCALAIEELFTKAGFPENVFSTLMIPSSMVEAVITNQRVQAVTLTGSGAAGGSVASAAAKHIKKAVLELGGSDAFIVLDDADLDNTVKAAVTGRMINQGQSCIAAKRFIVDETVVEEFTLRLLRAVSGLKTGDPMDPATDMGPMARPDLVEDVEKQVQKSLESGATLVYGGKRPQRPGCYYLPTILRNVRKGMAVYHEETFGPVFSIITVKSEEEAIAVANDSEFGLGGCVWTKDPERGEKIARKIETGAMFVNGITKSDPRLPFGGIKKSGYGRELATYGIREFVNIKTIWIG
ncbi:MAG: NAD-dependent succinate-semialdehyde dehydrogenase [Bacteroidetes bacterium]|nr:NAD-dependent succinate-semialdehyde dehydrogenase [Bacteroidota bacterium]